MCFVCFCFFSSSHSARIAFLLEDYNVFRVVTRQCHLHVTLTVSLVFSWFVVDFCCNFGASSHSPGGLRNAISFGKMSVLGPPPHPQKSGKRCFRFFFFFISFWLIFCTGLAHFWYGLPSDFCPCDEHLPTDSHYYSRNVVYFLLPHLHIISERHHNLVIRSFYILCVLLLQSRCPVVLTGVFLLQSRCPAALPGGAPHCVLPQEYECFGLSAAPPSNVVKGDRVVSHFLYALHEDKVQVAEGDPRRP